MRGYTILQQNNNFITVYSGVRVHRQSGVLANVNIEDDDFDD